MSLSTQQYADLAKDAYNLDYKTGVRAPGGEELVTIEGIAYSIREHVDNPRTGYQGTIYQRVDTGEIVVSHRGSEFSREFLKDGAYADGGMVFTRTNLQAKEAIELTRHALKFAKQSAPYHGGVTPEVTVTGHSLGGTLAQISAHYFDLRGETFNPYGATSLGYRIPTGGDRVLNHVMAADPVSAASPQYGQVRMYATPEAITRLSRMGYANDHNPLDPRAPVRATFASFDSHKMHNFLDVDAAGNPDKSVLNDPQARQLARQYEPMIDKYRFDVRAIRTGLTSGARTDLGKIEDVINYIRGPLAPGEPAQHAHRTKPDAAVIPATNTDKTALPCPTPTSGSLPDYLLYRSDAQERQTLLRPESFRHSTTIGLQYVSLDKTMNTVDRLLAGAQSGDWDAFRKETQTLANGQAGRDMRTEAGLTVDRQEQQAATQQAAQQAAQIEQPALRGPRMH